MQGQASIFFWCIAPAVYPIAYSVTKAALNHMTKLLAFKK